MNLLESLKDVDKLVFQVYMEIMYRRVSMIMVPYKEGSGRGSQA